MATRVEVANFETICLECTKPFCDIGNAHVKPENRACTSTDQLVDWPTASEQDRANMRNFIKSAGICPFIEILKKRNRVPRRI